MADSAEFIFKVAVDLESNPDTMEKAAELYRQILEQQPDHAAALINLGAIYYHQQNYLKAEMQYRLAIAADSRYALAYFDLGNVLDETGQHAEAITMYQRALEIAPTYADVHYNLALVYEKVGRPRDALRHWERYAKLDTSGPWSSYAKAAKWRIIIQAGFTVVVNPAPVRTEERAALFLVAKGSGAAQVPSKHSVRRAPANQQNLFGVSGDK